MTARTWSRLAVVVVAIWPGTGWAQGAQPPSLEAEVKAAFLVHFIGYTEWPADAPATAREPLHVCLAGRDPFGGALERTLAGDSAAAKRVSVRVLDAGEPVTSCAVLFIPRGIRPEPWLGKTSAHTLSIGEAADFLRRGGIIQFVVDAGRVRFDIDLDRAHSSKIRLNSRLLRLARRTVGGTGQ